VSGQVTPIAIYGAGSLGRELAWIVQSCNRNGPLYEIVCFIEEPDHLTQKVVHDLPVLTLDEARERHLGARVLGAVQDPTVRQRLVQKAAAAGFEFATIVHPNVECSPRVSIGTGTVIAAGSIVMPDTTLGQHVWVDFACTVGHDVVMEDFATLSPGVHVSGWVRVEHHAYIGTGVNIINGTEAAPLVIGAHAVIGAGACVVGSIPPSVTAVGVPARPR
jgi:sugar O-acyltransferase (sialic acid O-acetyltransferase NeuD family)